MFYVKKKIAKFYKEIQIISVYYMLKLFVILSFQKQTIGGCWYLEWI